MIFFLQVMLPTGTKVTVKDSYQAFINIFIYPSAADYNKTEGTVLREKNIRAIAQLITYICTTLFSCFVISWLFCYQRFSLGQKGNLRMKANVMSAVKKILILLSNCWCLYMYMYRLNHANLNFNSIFINIDII